MINKEKIEDLYTRWVKGNYAYTTDSRRVEKGDIYFALKGERFDGNDYALMALEKGAEAVVVDDDVRYKDTHNVILVDDVLKTLQCMATMHREKMGIPILSLTGSNGKTTSKELISRVLACKFNVCATRGNLNNHIGVPFTLLSLRPHHEFAVVEMGASHPGEIAELSQIAHPNYAYITNFGRAHLEGFGGVEGVIRTKSELYDYVRATSGVAFVNADDAVQMEKSEGISRFTFSSTSIPADVTLKMLTSLPQVTGMIEYEAFSTHLSGEYNFTNAAAAASIGVYFGIDKKDIANAIYSYVPDNNRSQWIERGAHSVMCDAYNANPTSMTLSVKNFANADINSLPKIAVLGDMFELGEYAESEHQSIVDMVAGLPFEKVYVVGENFNSTTTMGDKVEKYPTFEAFAVAFVEPTTPHAFLVKGSRGMAMERFLELLDKH